jgi:hypothetical protein
MTAPGWIRVLPSVEERAAALARNGTLGIAEATEATFRIAQEHGDRQRERRKREAEERKAREPAVQERAYAMELERVTRPREEPYLATRIAHLEDQVPQQPGRWLDRRG